MPGAAVLHSRFWFACACAGGAAAGSIHVVQTRAPTAKAAVNTTTPLAAFRKRLDIATFTLRSAPSPLRGLHQERSTWVWCTDAFTSFMRHYTRILLCIDFTKLRLDASV